MLTTKEISEMLSVSEETVRRWIRTSDLKATQKGKSYFVDSNDLTRFVQEKATDGTSSAILKIVSMVGAAGIAAIPVNGKVHKGSSSIAKIIKMINSKGKLMPETTAPNDIANQTIEEIQDYIDALNRQKKKLDLEYQMNLLQIDEEIAKYQKIKKIEME